jgi:hypothetical protein
VCTPVVRRRAALEPTSEALTAAIAARFDRDLPDGAGTGRRRWRPDELIGCVHKLERRRAGGRWLLEDVMAVAHGPRPRPRHRPARRHGAPGSASGAPARSSGMNPQPSQRTQLQRDPDLVRRAALPTHGREILTVEHEVPHQVAPVDRLRPSLQTLDLSVGEKPSRRHRRSVVDLEVLDRQQAVDVRGQAVAPGGLQPAVTSQLGDEHEI